MITRYKIAGEIREYAFDFSNMTEIAGGDTLEESSDYPQVTSDPEGSDYSLEIAEPEIEDNVVKVVLSGGIEGESYVLTCLVDTASGKRLGARVTLIII